MDGMVRSSLLKEVIMSDSARNILRGMLLVAIAAGAPGAALAGKKCHKCDFSDEPIIVVGDKPAQKQPQAPAAGSLRTAPRSALPLRTAQPAPALPKLLGKPAPGVAEAQLHCNTVALCNELISHCAEHGGQWVPGTSQGPNGEPASGDCFID
jgi:hypothetical protein